MMLCGGGWPSVALLAGLGKSGGAQWGRRVRHAHWGLAKERDQNHRDKRRGDPEHERARRRERERAVDRGDDLGDERLELVARREPCPCEDRLTEVTDAGELGKHPA